MNEIEIFCHVLKLTPAEFIERTVVLDVIHEKLLKYISVYTAKLAANIWDSAPAPDLGFIQFANMHTIVKGNYYAIGIQVDDMSMLPFYPPGSVVIVNTYRRQMQLGKSYAYHNGGAVYFGTYMRAAPGATPHLLPIAMDREYLSDPGRVVSSPDCVLGEIMLGLTTDDALPKDPVALGHVVSAGVGEYDR